MLENNVNLIKFAAIYFSSHLLLLFNWDKIDNTKYIEIFFPQTQKLYFVLH